jgi:hypothetical protein
MTNQETAAGIDWQMWLNAGPLQSWKACALSMNVNPDAISPSMAVPQGSSQSEFDKRRRMLEGNLFRGGEFTPGDNWQKWVPELLWLVRMPEFAAWCRRVGLSMPPDLAALAMSSTVYGQAWPESAKDRQDRRLKACEEAGLEMPSTEYEHLPNGVGELARVEGVKRQSFSADVRAALKRRAASVRAGATPVRPK